MPAYRSAAEAEIRESAVARLREIAPNGRIIHEINAGTWGPNRIDLISVTPTRIIAVEVKSCKDKLDRLEAQISSMNWVAHQSFAAIHEKFLDVKSINGMAEPQNFPPNEARNAVTWVWPRKRRSGHVEVGSDWHSQPLWAKERACPPDGAITMLWRAELHEICRSLSLKGVSKMTMDDAIDAIKWRLTGEEITRAVCRLLRARKCVEADPPILSVQAVGELI